MKRNLNAEINFSKIFMAKFIRVLKRKIVLETANTFLWLLKI